jgi:antitoxin PrlF
MPTRLTSKGQVTIPKYIRDALHLQPGMAVEFSVNALGEVVIHASRHGASDRFEVVRVARQT